MTTQPTQTTQDKRLISRSLFRDNYICCLRGPILFTAPHSIALIRKLEYSNDIEIHLAEKYTAEIALILSYMVSDILNIGTSFMVWNLFKGCNTQNKDPNYLDSSNFKHMEWHECIHKFKEMYHKNYDKWPLLHIDIHGKADREDNLDFDLGIGPMKKHWLDKKSQQFMKLMKDYWKKHFAYLSNYTQFNKKSNKNMKLGIEVNPWLAGVWHTDTLTMANQSTLLGIPSTQLEIPFTMRKLLGTDLNFIKLFAEVIAKFYICVVRKERFLIKNVDLRHCNENELNYCENICPYSEYINDSDSSSSENEECKMKDEKSKINGYALNTIELSNGEIKKLVKLLRKVDWKQCKKQHLKGLMVSEKYNI